MVLCAVVTLVDSIKIKKKNEWIFLFIYEVNSFWFNIQNLFYKSIISSDYSKKQIELRSLELMIHF